MKIERAKECKAEREIGVDIVLQNKLSFTNE